jgi:hypothetical protein
MYCSEGVACEECLPSVEPPLSRSLSLSRGGGRCIYLSAAGWVVVSVVRHPCAAPAARSDPALVGSRT